MAINLISSKYNTIIVHININHDSRYNPYIGLSDFRASQEYQKIVAEIYKNYFPNLNTVLILFGNRSGYQYHKSSILDTRISALSSCSGNKSPLNRSCGADIDEA